MERSVFSRIVGLLDIYSPRLAARLVVLGLMLSGVVLLIAMPTGGRALGAFPFVLLVAANRGRFIATVERLLERHSLLVFAIPLSVLVARLLVNPPGAGDDLLKHIVVSFWPGGYREMYPHSRVPEVELYLGFDWLVGRLAHGIGPVATMWVVQATALVAFCWVFVRAGAKRLAGQPMASALLLVALTVALALVGGRLMLGRPEVFLSIWSLAAFLVGGGAGVLVWGFFGLLIGTGYWLAPIYFPAVFVLSLPLRQRMGVFLALLMLWNGWWAWATSGGYLEGIASVLLRTVERVPGIHVTENASVLNYLGVLPFVLVLLCAVWATRQRAVDRRPAMLAGYFALSNQMRYVSMIVPLLLLQVLEALRSRRFDAGYPVRAAAVLVCAVAMGGVAGSIPTYASLPRFALPEGSKVFTGFTVATYSTMFANPGKVRMVPGFDIGALDQVLQKLVVDLSEGRVDCEGLRKFEITHVVEDTLKGPVPECLELEATQGAWRLWQLKSPGR